MAETGMPSSPQAENKAQTAVLATIVSLLSVNGTAVVVLQTF